MYSFGIFFGQLNELRVGPHHPYRVIDLALVVWQANLERFQEPCL